MYMCVCMYVCVLVYVCIHLSTIETRQVGGGNVQGETCLERI